MLITKLEGDMMVEIQGGLNDKNGIYTIHEADYESICSLVDDSRKEKEVNEDESK